MLTHAHQNAPKRYQPAAAHNPTLGQGVALGLRAAQQLATHADEVVADPTGYHA
jgi:hypothetical protein